MYNTSFTVRGVGQGLFYTGTIGRGGQASPRFAMVYDCGTTSQRQFIKSEMSRPLYWTRHITTRPYRSIEMLTISHYDYDHINGIPDLLKICNVTNVFMPYLSPVERLALALSKVRFENWYYDFLSDPATFLLNTGRVQKIIVMGGGATDGDIEAQEDGDRRQDEMLTIDLPPDPSLVQEIRTNDPGWLRDGRIRIKNHDGRVVVEGLWLFRFFCYRWKEKMYRFTECLREHGIIGPQGKERRDSEWMRSIITHKGIRPDLYEVVRPCLKQCYVDESPGKEINNSSLALYHGPIDGAISRYRLSKRQVKVRTHETEHYTVKGIGRGRSYGQLLLGDINLQPHVYKEMKKHYRSEQNLLCRVYLCLLPHHGSAESWNENILSDLSRAKVWVASSGISHQNRHPRISVVSDIVNDGKLVLLSNEINSVEISSDVHWP